MEFNSGFKGLIWPKLQVNKKLLSLYFNKRTWLITVMSMINAAPLPPHDNSCTKRCILCELYKTICVVRKVHCTYMSPEQ